MQRLSSLVFVVALMTLAGCATTKNKITTASNEPDWVTNGAGAFKDNGQGVFYGIGVYKGSQNPAMSRTGADERACADIAKTLNRYVTTLTKDYMAATSAGSMDKTSDEQHTEAVLKSFSKFTLVGASVIKHWKDPNDGTLYALCKLDMASVKKSLDDSKELDSKLRDYVKANAEKAFDELAAEEAKH